MAYKDWVIEANISRTHSISVAISTSFLILLFWENSHASQDVCQPLGTSPTSFVIPHIIKVSCLHGKHKGESFG